MKKIAILALASLMVITFFGNAAFAGKSSNPQVKCGASKWKKIFEVDVEHYYVQAQVMQGSVADIISAHNQGCDIRVQYTYRYADESGSDRNGNKLYTCSITSTHTLLPGISNFTCFSPLWFGFAEEGSPKMLSEVVQFGQTEEFPNEATVGVTLYEAHKDVQGVTELFPSTASGSVRVFVRR